MKIKALLLDLDGTIYHGERVIPGVPATIERLRKQGIRPIFVSNASMRSRAQQRRKLLRMGISCRLEEVYNTAYATAEYIRHHHPRARVYCISQGGLQRELRERGIRVTRQPRADIVVTGLDMGLNYRKLAGAFQALQHGARFIASNTDRIYPTEKGLVPGSGTIAAFLTYGTGVKPLIIGKPSPGLFREILRKEKLRKDEVVALGDNIQTDGQAAVRSGLRWILVLSGISKRKDAARLPIRQRPWKILGSLNEIGKILTRDKKNRIS